MQSAIRFSLATCLLLLLGSLSYAQEERKVDAKITPGNITGGKERTVTITTQSQKILWHHANFKGGGINYSVTISIKADKVIIEEHNCISTETKYGNRMKDTHISYTFDIPKLPSKSIELQLGNRIVLTTQNKQVKPNK